MQKALVIGATGGIGGALCRQLSKQGFEVVALSRSHSGLDITSETSIQRHLGDLEGPFDLIFVATGALEIEGAAPEKTIRTVSEAAMLEQFRLNCVGPALVFKHAMKLLPRDRRSVLAALSARVGSIGDNALGGWYSYRTAKAGLNQIVKTTSIELARSHKDAICVALHPGTVATAFTEKYLGRHPAVSPDQAALNLWKVLQGLEVGDTGRFVDWSGEPIPW
jgi:NAD(P)-dependent dehydrogenase (short-subunit alcohol dehydrogenase family)